MKRCVFLLVIVFAGCLGPRADPSAFFLLSPAPTPSDVAATPVVLGVGPILLPGYLDRPQIVVRVSDNEIALTEADRWAEPLRDNLARTLQENLSRLLPGSSYVAYPWYAADAPQFAISLDVRRFEADAAGAVVLDATWRMSSGDELLELRASRIQESAEGTGRASVVAAQSRALAALSSQIAVAVRRARGG